jgi:hypothetical protein
MEVVHQIMEVVQITEAHQMGAVHQIMEVAGILVF